MQDHAGSDSKRELVTVVIPTYNRLPLLREAIDSVRGQTYTNWELVIVDDGSTDGTVEAIHRINDPRITILANQHVGNPGFLRNAGAAVGKGKWLAFLDSDDLWISTKLDDQVKKLNEEGRLWIYGGSGLINANGEKKIRKDNPILRSGWIVEEIINTEVDFFIGSIVVEKELFEKLEGFNTAPELFCREDHEFALRLALNAEASVVDHTTVLIREHPGRTTHFMNDSHERSASVYDAFVRYNKDKFLEKQALKRRTFHLLEASVYSFAKSRIKDAFKQLWSARRGVSFQYFGLTFARLTFAASKSFLRNLFSDFASN